MNFVKQDSIKWASRYIIGTISQIGVVCFIVAILRINNIQYDSKLNLIFLAIGGLSSATWGTIISKKSQRIKSYKEVLKDFFSIKQPLKCYALVLIYLFIIFGQVIVLGKINDGVQWYTFIILFVQSILFGGIEEIGWRYTYQPLLEKRVSFQEASIITWLSWGTWHYMYFYFTNTLGNINHISFIVSLLASCFILGSIYRVTKSLWLCVMYHALLNVFSQTMGASTFVYTVATTFLCIGISIFLVRKNK